MSAPRIAKAAPDLRARAAADGIATGVVAPADEPNSPDDNTTAAGTARRRVRRETIGPSMCPPFDGAPASRRHNRVDRRRPSLGSVSGHRQAYPDDQPGKPQPVSRKSARPRARPSSNVPAG